MKTIGKILENQTIRLDNHHPNTVIDRNDPGQDIHLDKASILTEK